MATGIDDRRSAIEAADGTCPRCGSPRADDQHYCLECGLQLPPVTGTLPRLRRTWMRRVGWYPGDWVWVSLLTLVVAAVGAASSIVLTERHDAKGPTFTATATVPVVEPTAVPTGTTPAPGSTATLPTAPEPTTTAPVTKPKGPVNGRLAWPANANGWTIVLVSYPKINGRPAALATATKAAHSGLRQVGILDSSGFASLQPGYFVVFTGIYGSKSDADAAVSTARQAGFGGAYSRQVAR
jgi:hypothetical protein